MTLSKTTAKRNSHQPHPYADLFPMMDREPLRQLTASIREEGLQNPIITYEGKILDGRNRAAACANAQVEPRYEEYEGDDPLGFVFRANLIRRHLNTSQRAMVAEKFANLENGERASQKCEAVTRQQAADILNVSPRTLDNAKVVRASGDDELIKAVEQGEVSVSTAAKQVTAPSGDIEQLSESELRCQKLLSLWDKSDAECRALFLDAIGAKA